jgi:hypothetical protein
MEQARRFAVHGSETHVEAWSAVRLPFEPKGWLSEYRRDLRTALRSMRASQAGVLYAEYATPNQSFADLENVLLYNLGSGCFSHLAREGLSCRRVASRDDLHYVRYTSIEPEDACRPGGQLLASVRLIDLPPGSTPAHWWSAFREQLKVHGEIGTLYGGELGITAELGSSWSRRDIAPSVKTLLDGLISALHVHDWSNREHLVAALDEIGHGERLWDLLNDPAMAFLGPRRLVRPHGRSIAWNPADERCGFFQFTRSAQADAVTVRIHALSR